MNNWKEKVESMMKEGMATRGKKMRQDFISCDRFTSDLKTYFIEVPFKHLLSVSIWLNAIETCESIIMYGTEIWSKQSIQINYRCRKSQIIHKKFCFYSKWKVYYSRQIWKSLDKASWRVSYKCMILYSLLFIFTFVF